MSLPPTWKHISTNLLNLFAHTLCARDGFSLITEAFQGFVDANSINAGSSAEKISARVLGLEPVWV